MKIKLSRVLTKFLLSCCLVFTLASSSVNAKIIYHAKNEFGPLWVHKNNDELILSFVPDGSIYQSIMKLDQPLIIQFDYIKFFIGSLFLNKAPERILLIGLGGGTAAKAINTMLPQTKLDIVEINPLIPRVAENYFLYKPNNNTDITVTDGYLFVLNTKDSKYDLILIDAFDKDYIPAPFLTDKFVKNVKRILKKNGAVAVNTFVGSKFSYTESNLYKSIFKNFFELTNDTSRVIIAKKGALPHLSQVKENAGGWAFTLYQVGIDAKLLSEKFDHRN